MDRMAPIPTSYMPRRGSELVRVWLVEDERQYRETLAYLIDHTTGMECSRRFERGETALEALEILGTAAYPDVMLMDVNLPGLSGLECASRVKACLPQTPIVMLTIRDDAETIFEAFRAGASGYLVKDAHVDQIIAAVREALSGGMLMPAPVARKVRALLSEPAAATVEYGLSAREKDVLEHMVAGHAQKEIAERLFISPATVSTHIQHIYQKLHVRSGSAAVAKAVRERLV